MAAPDRHSQEINPDGADDQTSSQNESDDGDFDLHRGDDDHVHQLGCDR